MKNLKEFKEALKRLEEKIIEKDFELEIDEEKRNSFFYITVASCFRPDRNEVYEEDVNWTHNEFYKLIEEVKLEKYLEYYDHFSLDENLGIEAFFNFDYHDGPTTKEGTLYETL